MNITELRAKNNEELKDLVLSLKKEQFNLRMQESTGALENKSHFKEVRRTIARAKMLMGGKTKSVPTKAAVDKAATKKTASKAKKG